MIIGSRFPGDSNMPLMCLQQGVYGELVGLLFRRARRRYESACILVGVTDELRTMSNSVARFAHKSVENAHDLIAARFRSLHPDALHLKPAEPADVAEALLRRAWIDFFENEVRDLCEASDDFTRSTLESVIHSGQERGAQAEKKVAEILNAKYGFNP
jgi:hypothetical protein